MFYDRYLELCKKANLSPSTAATKAGFNRGTVSVWKKKYEDGKDVDPDQEIINKICAFFGCSENYIRGIPENMVLTREMVDSAPTDAEIEFFEWFMYQASEHQRELCWMVMQGGNK